MSGEARQTQVVIYMDEARHYHAAPAYAAILNFLMHHGVASALATRGLAGFGPEHKMHSGDLLAASDHLPLRIEFVAETGQVPPLLPKLREMAGPQATIVLTPAERAEAPRAAPSPAGETAPAAPPAKIEGRAKLLRIYCSEHDRWQGQPLHLAILEALQSADAAGATIYRGIAGYGAHHQAHPEKFHGLGFGQDRPQMISVVDHEAKVRDILNRLEPMLNGALAVLSEVEVIRYGVAE